MTEDKAQKIFENDNFVNDNENAVSLFNTAKEYSDLGEYDKAIMYNQKH